MGCMLFLYAFLILILVIAAAPLAISVIAFLIVRKISTPNIAWTIVTFAIGIIFSLPFMVFMSEEENSAAGFIVVLTLLYSIVSIAIFYFKAPKRKPYSSEICSSSFKMENYIDIEDDCLLINDDFDSVDYMEGHDFEHYCANLLEANGFYNVEVTQGSNDQGVDVLAEKDSVKYAIQCKNYSTPLSNTPIQEVHAGKMFYHCHVGVVMTNSTFTNGAKQLAEATGVLLWDRAKLYDLHSVFKTEIIEPTDNIMSVCIEESSADETQNSEIVVEATDEYKVFENIDVKVRFMYDAILLSEESAHLVEVFNVTGNEITLLSDKLYEYLSKEKRAFIEKDISYFFSKSEGDSRDGLLRYGKQVKDYCHEINIIAKQIEIRFQCIYLSLKEHGFDGWENDRKTFRGIKSLHKELMKFSYIIIDKLVDVNKIIKDVKIPLDCNDSKITLSLDDIEKGLTFIKNSIDMMEHLMEEHKKLKCKN